MYKPATYLVLCCLLFSKVTICMALNVPLEIKERAGVARDNQPVTYGVPFSEGDNITSIDKLSISGVDAQFRLLSRYNGDIRYKKLSEDDLNCHEAFFQAKKYIAVDSEIADPVNYLSS